MSAKPNVSGKWTPTQGKKDYEALAKDITLRRGHPLLVLFYPHLASVHDGQIEYLYAVLRESGLHQATPLEHIDVLLHTVGGDPTTAYRMAQVIRDFAKSVSFLVPRYAFSAGTLMCLSANEILLGDHAVLSPIDITLITSAPSDELEEQDTFPGEGTEDSEVETVAIDYFIQVAKQARLEIEGGFRQRGWKSSRTEVECSLLVEMTRQLGVLNIAKYYREKNITQEYAEELLRYMFPAGTKKHIQKILRGLVVEAPSHEFPIDYHLCQDLGLKVEEMGEVLSDSAREAIRTLDRLAFSGAICPEVHGDRRPLFQYLAYAPQGEPVAPEGVSKDGEAHGTNNGTAEKIEPEPVTVS